VEAKIDLPEVWKKARLLLKEQLTEDIFNRWISVIQPISNKKDNITLSVANDYYQDWLEENYLPLIQNAIASVTGEQFSVCFEVNSIDPASAAGIDYAEPDFSEKNPINPPPPIEKVPKKKNLKPILNHRYSFNSFIVGPSNNFAHAACLAVSESPARAYNPLFIYGGVGLGKTHLMQSIGNYAYESQGMNVCYVSSEEFINQYIDALQRRQLVQFRNKYRKADVLLIDDIQFLSSKEQMQEEFFHTFNTLFDSHKQIVLTSDRPAAEIPDLEQRLVSRFEWGLSVELEQPNVETRIAILRNKEEELNLSIDPLIINYIAENIRSNIRKLEGALIRVSSFASLTGTDLDLPTVENLLSDAIDQEKQNTILTMEDIQRLVADYYDIRYTDIVGKRKPASIAMPRQVAMYLCRDMTSYSLPAIGEAFGKNHATVLYAVRVVESRLKEESSLRQEVNSIRQKLAKRV